MTVCVVEDSNVRVNIMPKKTGTEDAAKGGADSNTALTTPLSVTGTAEELDRDLPQAIVEFVASHLTLKQSLEATQAEMDAADKLAKAEAKNKFQTGKKPTPATTAAKTSEKPEPPKPPAPQSLFDFPETCGWSKGCCDPGAATGCADGHRCCSRTKRDHGRERNR